MPENASTERESGGRESPGGTWPNWIISWTGSSVPIPDYQISFSCPCGRSIRLSGDREIEAWFKRWELEHPCAIRDTPVQQNTGIRREGEAWQVTHVGKPCTICLQVMNIASELTTLQSKPIHVACRKCYSCGEPKPTQMRWERVDIAGHPTKDVLMHSKCAEGIRDKKGGS